MELSRSWQLLAVMTVTVDRLAMPAIAAVGLLAMGVLRADAARHRGGDGTHGSAPDWSCA
jgi:hypothetical protein